MRGYLLWCLAAAWLGVLLVPGVMRGEAPTTAPDKQPLGWRVAYDKYGRIAESFDPAGRATKYTYVPATGERLQSVTQTPPEGAGVSWRFDDKGRLVSMADAAGEVAYKYDQRGQIEAVERQGTAAIHYSYDIAGRVTELKVGDFYRVAWTYDFLGRVAKMDTPAGPVTYEYLTGENTVVRSLPNGVKTFWKRQANGQLEKITHGFFEKPDDTKYSVLAKYTYQYGADGRIAAIHERSPEGDVARDYTYDKMGRLVRATGPGGQVYSYDYDLLGNRVKATASGRPDQNCTYDWAGRLTSVDEKPCKYDASGNLTDVTLEGVPHQYRFHADGRMAEAKVGDAAVQYGYDGFGRLISRKTAGGETRFIPDPRSEYWQPLVVEEAGGKRTLVIWEGATPLAMVGGGAVEWMLHDHLGSVRVITDFKGKTGEHYQYDPFGVPEGANHTPTQSGLAGVFWDASSAVYLTRGRALLPALGGFLQPDPQKCLPSAAVDVCSQYASCGSDMVNFADRSGRDRELADRGGNVEPPTRNLWDDFKFFWSTPVRGNVVNEIYENSLKSAHGDVDRAQGLITEWRNPKDYPYTIPYPKQFPSATVPTAQELQGAAHYALAKDQPLAAVVSPIWDLPIHYFGERSNGLVKPSAFTRVATEKTWVREPVQTIGYAWKGAWESVWQRVDDFLCPSVYGDEIPPGILASTSGPGKRGGRGGGITRPPGWPRPPGPQGGPPPGPQPKPGGPPLSGSGSIVRDSPLAPSPVGGVYLGGAGASVDGLGMLKGLGTDANGNLVLLSEQGGDIKLPPLRMDDLVSVFRSVYLDGEGPTVTIDPNPENPEKSAMIIKHSKATKDTYAGWVLYEADRLMKGYTLGVDNLTQKDIASQIAGYGDVQSKIYFGAADDPRKEQKDGVWERFWIVPASANRFQGQRRQLTLFDVPLKVKTQKMKWVKDKLEDDLTGKSSPGAEAFTEWFTKNYEGISAEQLLLPPAESGITAPVPVFAELRRIALMTVIAEKLRDQGVAMPFWMRDYEVKPVPFETTTPAMEIKREKTDGDVVRTARIFGGVELSPESKLVKTYGSGAEAAKAPPEIREEVNRAVKLADSLETAVTKATPVGSTPLAVFSVKDASDNHVYQGVSLPGAASLALNPARLSQVDMSVPIVGGRDIRLVRSFNSFFNPNGPWGKGWAMDLPRLEPAIRDGNKYYELLTPLNSLYARFSEIKAVPELQNAQLQVSDEKGPFYGLADAQPKFLSNTKTQLLLLKDGTCWHFTPHGDLVAIEDGPQITIYERGNRGQVTRIVALFDGVCVAQIELKYTDKGTLAKAVGSTFGRPSAQPMEVSYAYDLSEHLASVRTAEGAVGYAYQGPWVASVTWTDKAADAKPELLSSYEYNAHGQVTDEKRGTTPLHYAIAAAAGGGLETTVSNVADKAHPSSTSYDRQMRPTDAKDADGTHTVWTYPSAGGVQATLTTPDQRKVTVTEIPEKDGGHKRILQTDGLPEVTAKVDAGGHLTTFGEGGQTLLKQEWRTDGQMAQQLVGAQAASFTYSKGGLLSSVLIHPSLEQEHIKTWHETALDWRGLPTRVTDCTGLDVAVNYDAAGRLTSIVQKTAKGNEGYSIERDDAGRPLAVKSSWGQTSYAYAKDGLLQRVETTRDDHTASVELTHGLVRKIAGFDMGVTSFEYDNKDETLRSVTCANGLKLANDYDANRRLASVSLGAERRVKLEYDVDGRVVGYILEPLSP